MPGEAGLSTQDGSGRAQSILRDASKYTAATYVTWVGISAVGLVTKGLLGPTNVGIWSLLNIMLSYLSGAQLGCGDAVAKEVPYLRRKGDFATAQRLGDAMLGFVTLASAVTGLGVAVIALWVGHSWSTPLRIGLVVVGLGFPLWMFVNMQIMASRAAKQFDVLSQQLVLQLAVTALIGIPLMWRWSIYGQYATYVASSILFVFFFHHAAKREPLIQFAPRLDRRATLRLMAVGLPLQVSNGILLFQTTADSLLAARALGITALGYYSLAVTVKSYIYQTPTAFAVVMFPRFQEKFAESRDTPAALQDYVEKPIVGFSYLVLPLLIGASWEVVPFLVRHFLPAFVPAIGPIKLLLIGSFFASLWQMPSQFLIAINKVWQNAALSCANAALVAGAVVLTLAVRASVESVAVGTSAAYAVASLTTIGYAVLHYRSRWDTVRFLFEVFLAGGVLFGLLAAADWAVPDGAGLGTDVVRVLLRSGLLLAAALPMFWWADRAIDVRGRLRAWRART